MQWNVRMEGKVKGVEWRGKKEKIGFQDSNDERRGSELGFSNFAEQKRRICVYDTEIKCSDVPLYPDIRNCSCQDPLLRCRF